MGLDAVTLDDMAEYMRVVQGLLRRETLDWDYAGQRRTIRFLNPELELINLADAIPFYISAFGPRGKASWRLAWGQAGYTGSVMPHNLSHNCN
jgi:hypothetical protein